MGSNEYWSTAVAEISFPSPIWAKVSSRQPCWSGWWNRGNKWNGTSPWWSSKRRSLPLELPSPQAGRVVRIHGEPGGTINVGEPLIVFEVPDETAGIVGTVPKDEAPKRRVRLSAVLDED